MIYDINDNTNISWLYVHYAGTIFSFLYVLHVRLSLWALNSHFKENLYFIDQYEH